MATAALLGRFLLSLAAVFGLMWVAARMARKRGRLGPSRPGERLAVLARRPLGRRSAVAAVRAGSRVLVLGVSDTAVQLLADLDANDYEPAEAPDADNRTEPPGPARPAAALPPATVLGALPGLRVPRTGLPGRRGLDLTAVVEAMRERTVRR